MTQAEIEAFLEAPRHAIVATNRANGAPQLSVVWYIYEGETLYFSTAKGTAKYRNLLRDPRVSVCIDAGRSDVNNVDERSVVFYGTAQVIDEEDIDDAQMELCWKIYRRYYETDEIARASLVDTPDLVLVIVEVEKILSWNFNEQ
jgi:PPOX class probable F420-dependent enzyme